MASDNHAVVVRYHLLKDPQRPNKGKGVVLSKTTKTEKDAPQGGGRAL